MKIFLYSGINICANIHNVYCIYIFFYIRSLGPNLDGKPKV